MEEAFGTVSEDSKWHIPHEVKVKKMISVSPGNCDLSISSDDRSLRLPVSESRFDKAKHASSL
jgi:hypothetical protein